MSEAHGAQLPSSLDLVPHHITYASLHSRIFSQDYVREASDQLYPSFFHVRSHNDGTKAILERLCQTFAKGHKAGFVDAHNQVRDRYMLDERFYFLGFVESAHNEAEGLMNGTHRRINATERKDVSCDWIFLNETRIELGIEIPDEVFGLSAEDVPAAANHEARGIGQS